MKQSKLAPIITYTICLQMMLSPLAASAEAERRGPTGSERVMGALNVFTTVMGGIQGNQQQQQPGLSPSFPGNQAKLAQVKAGQPDKVFGPDLIRKLPGFAEYLALPSSQQDGQKAGMFNCQNLPTVPDEVMCSETPNMQPQEIQAYLGMYKDIKDTYTKYQKRSHAKEPQLFGLGCMQNGMEVIDAFFKHRLNELNELKDEVEQINAAMKDQTKNSLTNIENLTAFLEGEGSAIGKKVKSRNAAMFDYGKQFEGNAACKSMFSPAELDKVGKSKGFRSIAEKIGNTRGEKGGEFSAESYTQSKEAVRKDIQGLINGVSDEVGNNFSSLSAQGGFSKLIQDAQSSFGSSRGAGLINGQTFGSLQKDFINQNREVDEEKRTIERELTSAGVSPARIFETIHNPAASKKLGEELKVVERQMKNKCFETQKSGVNKDEILNRITKTNASDTAQKANPYQDALRRIIDNPKTSNDEKRAELARMEAQDGKRNNVKLDQPLQLSKDVSLSGFVTPTKLFMSLLDVCDGQFSNNKLGTTLSGAQALDSIKAYQKNFEANKVAFKNKVKQELSKKLLNCEDSGTANNTAVGSCTAERFNTSRPGFCVAAAESCSDNMNKCNAHVDAIKTARVADREKSVNQYNDVMKEQKAKLVRLFGTAKAQFEAAGQAMAGAFGVSPFTALGIQTEIPEGQGQLALFKGSDIQLDDPEALVKMFNDNIDKLKAGVEEQQLAVAQKLKEHMDLTKENYDNAIASMGKDCEGFLGVRQKEIFDQGKLQQELGQKKDDLCALNDAIVSDPSSPECSEVRQVANAALAASGQSNPSMAPQINQIRVDLQNRCANFQRNNPNRNGESAEAPGAMDYCSDAKAKTELVKFSTTTEVERLCKLVLDCPTTEKKTIPAGTTTPVIEIVPGDCSKEERRIVTLANQYKRANRNVDVLVAQTPKDDSPGTGNPPTLCMFANNMQGNTKSDLETIMDAVARGRGPAGLANGL